MADVIKMGWNRDIKARATQARVYNMSTVVKARKHIYELGKSLRSVDVTRLLQSTSTVPTLVRISDEFSIQSSPILQNAFSERLGPFGFNPFPMLVVDLMHEFELGIWKAVFSHLIRMLYAISPNGSVVSEFDRRFVILNDLSWYTDKLYSNKVSIDPFLRSLYNSEVPH
jgi:hypothetical protein